MADPWYPAGPQLPQPQPQQAAAPAVITVSGPNLSKNPARSGPMPTKPLSAEDDAMLNRWVEAKRCRDFGTADRIRSQLEAKGIKPDVVRPHTWEPPGSRLPRGPPPAHILP